MTLDLDTSTDGVLTADTHFIQSFADLNALKQDGARTVIVGADGHGEQHIRILFRMKDFVERQVGRQATRE